MSERNIYNLESYIDGGSQQPVVFVHLDEQGNYNDGTTLEEMLRVSIERLNEVNKKFPCRENSIAITKMQEALMWLNERTRDRRERGVEGKHEA